MEYKRLKIHEFFTQIQTETQARNWIWESRFGPKGFECTHCSEDLYYERKDRPEVRICQECRRETRIRAGTIFEHSKLPLLVWLRAIYFVMQGKRGIAALELKRQLGLSSYASSWLMLHKIREALRQRDEVYKLKDLVELDGAKFGRREKRNQATVLVAIESRDWMDDQGKVKSKAGFAKVLMTRESAKAAQKFVDTHIESGAMVNTDANNSYLKLKNVYTDYQIMSKDPEALDRWLPWVHKFISNAKSWVLGTHHGVGAKNIGRYLAEYTYRFNRRHDPNSLFHRALTACALAKPATAVALSGGMYFLYFF